MLAAYGIAHSLLLASVERDFPFSLKMRLEGISHTSLVLLESSTEILNLIC